MRLTRPKLLAAVSLSLLAHVAAAAILIEPQPEVEIAGGAAMSELVIGTAFEDSLAAGEADTTVEPVDTATETPPVAEPDTRAAQTEASAEPVPADTAELTPTTDHSTEVTPPAAKAEIAPVSEAVQAPSLVAALPARSEELSALPAPPEEPETRPEDPMELAALPAPPEIKPAEEPAPELALPETVPVPIPRPEPPAPETARAKPPVPAKTEAKKAEPKPAKPKRPKAGDGGRQAITASRSSSGSAEAKRTTAAGNAAVSNYPGKVASKLRRALRYPREAKRQGVRGDVVVSFVVSANGGVSGIRIARSSGSPVLDGAAADAVRRAAPFPQIPPGAGRSSWPFSVPLGFTR